MRSFFSMWIGEVAMNVCTRGELAPACTASPQRRTSFSFARASPQTMLSLIARAIACTASKSPLRRGRETRFDDVDAHALELARDAHLFFLGHRRAGALLAVAHRRVEYDQMVGHRGFLASET